MGDRNRSGVRRAVRNGKPVWIIDIRFTSKDGRRCRYRRDAEIQSASGARAEADRRRLQVMLTGTLEVKPAAPTLGAFVAGDFEALYMPRYRPSTAQRYRHLFKQGLLDALGSKPLDAVNAAVVQTFLAPLAVRGIKVRHPLNLVRTVLRAAVEMGLIERMPDLPKPPKQGEKIPAVPSDDEVRALVQHSRGWLRAAIALGAYAGLRSGEVRAIEVRDLDTVHGRIEIRRAMSGTAVMSPKSSSDRTVPLAPELLDLMQEALRSKLPAARIVTCAHGAPPSGKAMRERLNRLQAKLGLPKRTFHSLRHYFCSTLLRMGANIEAVRRMAGHSSLRVTMRYVRAAGTDLAAEIVKLPMWSETAVPEVPSTEATSG